MEKNNLTAVMRHFRLQGTVQTVAAMGEGLINDTFKATTIEADAPDYVLQRINHHVFQDVELLQRNIEIVTRHIRKKLQQQGETDIERKVLRFVPADNGKTWWRDESTGYWRVSVFIPRSHTRNEVTPDNAYQAGAAFGHFEQMLVDVEHSLGETIPDFHNMELRMTQLKDAVITDNAGRLGEVSKELDLISRHAEEMCHAEQLYREGKLPKRICHCDTKVNNMLFDEDGNVLCVIDLDTVMPSFVFSDYGDFLRTAANTVAEDSPEVEKVQFRHDIFEAFTRGYLKHAHQFLTPQEISMLPFAVALFPMMQAVRFLTDYLNGDTYYKTQYPAHNLVRTPNQLQLFRHIAENKERITSFIENFEK